MTQDKLCIHIAFQQLVDQLNFQFKTKFVWAFKKLNMRKSSLQTAFNPAETTLLSSLQRAKQKIFKKAQKPQTQNDTSNDPRTNDQNNSLNSNLQPRLNQSIIDQIKESRKASILSNQKGQDQSITNNNQNKKQRSSSQFNNAGSNNVAANAIKVLQQKIFSLQNKNKELEGKLSQSRISQIEENIRQNTKNEDLSPIQKPEWELKSYLLLKQEFESLQKQNICLEKELSKRKEQPVLRKKDGKQSGKKLNFHHEISQNISNLFQTGNNNENSQKVKDLEEKILKSAQQLAHYKNSLQAQRKKNFTILKLHQQQIIKNQELILELAELKCRIKQLKQSNTLNQRKSSSGRHSNQRLQLRHSQELSKNTTNQVSQAIIKRKNLELQKTLEYLRQELQNQRILLKQKDKQASQSERKYFEVKQVFIQLYKDLTKYHPDVISSHIKYLYDRIRKGENLMMKSRSISSRRFVRLSQTKNSKFNALSGFRSKSGKKGLKMQDLNSSKKSYSRQRTGSKNSNRSQDKSNYKSPYAQQNLSKRNRLKSALSPNDKYRYRSSNAVPQSNKAKLSEIQKIIKQIKEVSKQIKTIKAQHRNLSVKIVNIENGDKQSGGKSSVQQKNQERMNELIEQYNQKNSKLQELKLQKDRLALQTVPDALT